MQKLRPLKSALQVLAGSIVLVLILRTWVVLGLVLPVQVTGNSMAPALMGEHYSIQCPDCEEQATFAAEFATDSAQLPCPHCGKQSISLAESPLHAGDNLVVNRFSGNLRQPRRGEMVVLRNPTDPTQLCVKRVWGLPGESLRLQWGDVWVDGQPVKKTLPLQRALRLRIHQETAEHQRWQADLETQWRKEGSRWDADTRGHIQSHWLRYSHPADKPITDEYPYNAGLTRQLNLVRDIMLSARVKASGEGTLQLEIEAGQQSCRIAWSLGFSRLSLELDGVVVVEQQIPSRIAGRLAGVGVLVELSNFDGQILLAMDGISFLQVPWIPQVTPQRTSQPVALGAVDLQITVSELNLYRDLYYGPQAVGLARVHENIVAQLQPGQYYLLGDNSPISVDSRSWGPVAEELFLGYPLAN